MAKRRDVRLFGVAVAMLALGLLATNCGGDSSTPALPTDEPDPSAATETTAVLSQPTTTLTDSTTTSTTTTTAAPTTTTTTTTTVPAPPRWEQIAAGDDCMCADGSDYSYWVREADPERVVFYLEGGGACFSAETCSFTGGTYTSSISEDNNPNGAGGIFDFSNPANPLAGSSFVAVPYCTGDVHIGNNVHQYDDLTVYHNGFINASKAMAALVERFSDATEIVVAGSSAGSVAAPLFGGLLADLYPDAKISVVADASGAYPSNPLINATIGVLWNSFSIVPDWPVNAELIAADWGVPELMIQAGLHAPRIRFARFDNAFDSTQLTFAELAGFDATNMDQLIRDNETRIESAGVTVSSYLAPGADHTILTKDELYALEVEGVAFVDWLTEYLAADSPTDDVACVDCSV